MMTTLTDHAPFDVIDWPPETGLSPAPRAGRVWRSPKPERLVEVEPTPRRSRAGYVAGIATAAVIVAGVFTTARLDDELVLPCDARQRVPDEVRGPGPDGDVLCGRSVFRFQ